MHAFRSRYKSANDRFDDLIAAVKYLKIDMALVEMASSVAAGRPRHDRP